MFRRAALLVLPLAAAACAGAEAGPEAHSEPGALATLRLGSAPILQIGVMEGDERYTFQDVTSVLPLSSGDLLVADGGSGEVTRYTADGTFVRRWGGRGEGPGEFRALSRVYPWAGDSVAALDQQIGRLSVFDADGEFARQVDARDVSRDSLFAMDVWLYRRFWVDGAAEAAARQRVRSTLDRLPPPTASPGYRLVRVAADGRLWIREPGVSAAGERSWTVLEADGTPAAVVDVPERLDPQYIAVDRVLGRWRGENDVNFVRAYALQVGEGTAPEPAWLAAPRSRRDVEGPQEAEFLALIRGSIKEVASAEEIHYATHFTYTAQVDSLTWEAPEELTVDVVRAGTRGWTAVFTHPGLDRICGLSYGFNVPPGWRPGAIVCSPPPNPTTEG